jgi:hypothetical protein
MKGELKLGALRVSWILAGRESTLPSLVFLPAQFPKNSPIPADFPHL